MRYLYKRDKFDRKIVKRKSIIRHLFKSIIYMGNLSRALRAKCCFVLQRFCKRFFFVRIKSSCVITFNAHSIIKPFNVSRHAFRRFVSYGAIYGITKSIW